MKNKEKFINELVELLVNDEQVAVKNGKPCSCAETYCSECDFSEELSCIEKRKEWANYEYVEQVDWSKVNYGTFILVRDNEDEFWVERVFAFRSKKGFVCISLGDESKELPNYITWRYARLTNPNEEKQNDH